MFSLFKKIFKTPNESPQSENHALAAQKKTEGDRYLSAGDLDNAEHCYREAYKYNNNYCDALINIGYVLTEKDRHSEALSYLDIARALSPQDPDIFFLLGLANGKLGNNDAALNNYKAAIQHKPDFESAHLEACRCLLHSNRMMEALEVITAGTIACPTNPNIHYLRGTTLASLGKIEEAIATFEKCISLQPNFPLALINLATAHYSRINSINPKYSEAHNNLAGDLALAIMYLQRAIAIDPNYAEAHSNLGVALYEQGNVDEAIASFYQALKVNPNHIAAHSSLLFVMSFSQKHSPEDYLIEAKRFGEKVSKLVTQPLSTQEILKTKSTIRVGLVSGDLRVHPVGFFLESVIRHIKPEIIELYAYPTNDLDDVLSKRLKGYIKKWKPITRLSDESAARMIHDDGLDILIDLAGHSAHNRLPVFAWRPAPIQAGWLGFFASTGVAEIDYILVDPHSVPSDGHAHYSETPIFLPETRLCFTAPNEAPDVAPPPVLRNGYVTFGCFQNMTKLNDEVLKLWGQIAQAVPDAKFRLQIKQFNSETNQRLLQQRLTKFGIPAERTILCGPLQRTDYLTAHANVDIILDTFPYPGGTTTCEALWMGVPTLTLSGHSMLARQGDSIMSCAGLPDWVASDPEEYLTKAIQFAGDTEHLSNLRNIMRDQVSHSPLFDAPRFAMALTEILSQMYRKRINDFREDQ